MRRNILNIVFIIVFMFVSVALAACGGKSEGGASPADTAAEQEAGEPSNEADASNAVESEAAAEPADPLGKYAETVTVNEVLGFGPPEDPKTPKDITPETNGFVKDLRDMLNIEIKYMWTVPSSQFEQKFSLAVASGDLPDVMTVDMRQFEKFADQGILADLTVAYEKYASPALREYMESDGGFAMKAMTKDGKLLGIPGFQDPFLSTQILWIRTDWLKQLNLEPPKTMDDVEKIAEAFVKNDPDQDGKDDTYGLALNKELFFWGFDARGFFNGFGSYPKSWIKDAEGKLVAGEIQSETKQALAKLQSWYANGILDPEFALKDSDKTVEDIVAGKVGISYGEWWYPNWPLNLNREKEPNAEWKPYVIPGVDGPGKSLVPSLRLSRITAAHKDFAHPEAAIKMLNFYIEMDGNREYKEKTKAENGYVYNWFEPRIYNPDEFETTYRVVNEALNAGQETIEQDGPNAKGIADVFEAGKKVLDGTGTIKDWGLYYSRGAKDGGWGLTRQIRDSGDVVRDEFYGTPTDTMVKHGAQLEKMMNETFTEIIMGASVDKFDEYVKSWKALGGDQITKEVNEWYEANAVKP